MPDDLTGRLASLDDIGSELVKEHGRCDDRGRRALEAVCADLLAEIESVRGRLYPLILTYCTSLGQGDWAAVKGSLEATGRKMADVGTRLKGGDGGAASVSEVFRGRLATQLAERQGVYAAMMALAPPHSSSQIAQLRFIGEDHQSICLVLAKMVRAEESVAPVPLTSIGGRSDAAVAAVKDVVILVHGIRDFALWQDSVRRPLEDAGLVVESTNYGRFNLLKFLCPIPYFRNQAIATISRQMRIVRTDNPRARISVIAHSFGTYVVAKILQQQFDTNFHRVIFCGSVVRYDFDFEQFRSRFTGKIINEVGTRDVWPAMAESLTTGYGSAGTYGFRRPLVQDRWHNGAKHGYFLRDRFCEEFWVPVLTRDAIERTEQTGESPRLWVRLITVFKIKYLVVCFFLAILFYIYLKRS